MARNHNNAPQPTNPNQTPPTTPEATPFDYVDSPAGTPDRQTGMNGDPAKGVIDFAENLRRSAWEDGATADDVDALFNANPPRVKGGHETLLVIDQLRNEGRTQLLDSEKQLLTRMKLEGDVRSAHARVDFAAIASAHPNLSAEEAQIAATNELIVELKAKRYATADPTEKINHTIKIKTLQKFLNEKQNPSASGDDLLYGRLLQADYRARSASGAEKQVYEDKVKDLTKQAKAEDALLHINAGAYELLGEKYGKQPSQDPAQLPEDPRLESLEAAAARAEQERQQAQLEQHRSEMEEAELGELREYMASGVLKRGWKNLWEGKSHNQRNARYRKLCVDQAHRKYGDVLNNPNADPKLKTFLATKAVIEEQAKLRETTNEKIKNTATAKVCQFVGRHKILVMGGSLLLVPVTGGMSLAAGVALGGGIIAGSKVDEMFRKNGMRSADKAISMTEAMSKMRGKSEEDIHDFGMKKYERDRLKEHGKRLGAFAVGGAVTIVGVNLLPSTPGIDSAIHAADKNWVYAGAGAAGAFGANHQKRKKKRVL